MKLSYINFLFIMLLGTKNLVSQNLVPNPGFDIVDETITISGQLELAKPWRIVSQTPDLFGPNPNWRFLRPPLINECDSIYPLSGQYFAGISGYGRFEKEVIAVRLIEPLKEGIAYYVAAAVKADVRCSENAVNNLCHTSGLEINFFDFKQDIIPSISNDKILKQRNNWEILKTCYLASGAEREIRIGQTTANSKVKLDCVPNSNMDFHFSYYYIDDVVVDPFDVLPDKLVLCKDSSFQFDINFYNLPLRWEDGIIGGKRSINKKGIYKIFANVGDCELEDMVEIIEFDSNPIIENITTCNNPALLLNPNLNVKTIWNDGDTALTKIVTNNGTYTAKLTTQCGILENKFIVDNNNCKIEVKAPNVIRHEVNGDNSKAIFYFTSPIEVIGEFKIYDRYGNLIYIQNCQDKCEWDGTFNGKKVDHQVLVWTFEYTFMNNSNKNFVYGDLLVIK